MSKRELLARTLERTGLGRLLSGTAARWRGLLVYNYHRVGVPDSSPFDHALWSASQSEFDKQVQFLKKNMDVVRVADLPEVVRGGRGRAVLLTFDDGYRDNYELAWPVLRQHQTPATFFIASGFLDQRPVAWWDEIAWMVRQSPRPDIDDVLPDTLPLGTPEEREQSVKRLLRHYKSLSADQTAPFLGKLAEATGSGRCPADVADQMWMTWDMVREMFRSGMDIGGHTVSHPVLSQTDVASQRREIFESRARIEAEIGAPIFAFSYPVGQPDSFTGETMQLLREAGYLWAFSFYGGFCSTADCDPYNLPRVAVSPHVSPSLFRSIARLPQLFA